MSRIAFLIGSKYQKGIVNTDRSTPFLFITPKKALLREKRFTTRS